MSLQRGRSVRKAAAEGNTKRQVADSQDSLDGQTIEHADDDLNELPPALDAIPLPPALDAIPLPRLPTPANTLEDAQTRHAKFMRIAGVDAVGSWAKRLFVMDVEFHALANTSPICQLCAVSLDGSVAFNEYVFDKPLHPDWQTLVDSGHVDCDPFDDPRKSARFPVVFERLLRLLPADAILLYKGSIDLQRMMATLHACEEFDAQRILQLTRDIHVMPIEVLWSTMCKDVLPPFIEELVMTRNPKQANKLTRVYDALFWKPVLVHVPDQWDAPEEVVDMPIETAPVYTTRVAIQAEFLETEHFQPAFHTAHTDVLVTRNVLIFLLYYAQYHVALRSFVETLKSPQSVVDQGVVPVAVDVYAFQLFATRVVRECKWFRGCDLTPLATGAHYAWLILGARRTAATKLSNAVTGYHSVAAAPDVAELATQPYELSEEGLVPSIKAVVNVWQRITEEARQKRKQEKGLAVQHASEWVKVYVPRERGVDKFKLRALQRLIEYRAAGENAYDRLEAARHSTRPVGNRPWYYYPRAVSNGVITLHTRKCVFKPSVDADGNALDSRRDNVAVIDFDQPGKPMPGFSLRYCKSCKLRAPTPADPGGGVDSMLLALVAIAVTAAAAPPATSVFAYMGRRQ